MCRYMEPSGLQNVIANPKKVLIEVTNRTYYLKSEVCSRLTHRLFVQI